MGNTSTTFLSMPKKIIFASNNQHKADEIRRILSSDYEIITLKQAGIDIDIPEPHDTFQKNADEKSSTIYNMLKTDCFAEDSGLEVASLNGLPGVYSARYAGEHGNDSANMEKLLNDLKSSLDRTAQFKTVVSLMLEGEVYNFVGTCSGSIATEPRGNNGFGYDPIFIPIGYDKTFAELNSDEKNAMSHRKKAVTAMIDFLNMHQPK